MQCTETYEWPGQYLDVPGVRVEEGVVAVPAQGPAHPVPWGVTCFLSLGVLEWTGPPQAGSLWFNPPRSLGNWSHPLPLVSAWSSVDYSQGAAATLSTLDHLSAAWWSATGCALLSIQPIKIAQKLTVFLDFKSTAGCYMTLELRSIGIINCYFLNFSKSYICQKVLQEVLLNMLIFEIWYSSLKCSNLFKLGGIIKNKFVKCGKGMVKPNSLTAIQRSGYYPFLYKLDRVGRVDNRPSNNKLHQFVKKSIWHVTRDM